MSGLRVSTVVHYGADAAGELILKKEIVWPLLRLVPNDTYGSLGRYYEEEFLPRLSLGGVPIGPERLLRATFDGVLVLETATPEGLAITRTLFPSARHAACVESAVARNDSGKTLDLEIAFPERIEVTEPARGVHGAYVLTAALSGGGAVSLPAGASRRFALVFSGRRREEAEIALSAGDEEGERRAFLKTAGESLRLETPEPELDRMFHLAKIRAAESIFATQGGLLHSPGGGLHQNTASGRGRYYAAIWANDQAEYACPFFPYLGYETGNRAALNVFRHFARYMNAEDCPIPSSIIAEGTDHWNGAGDRGDMAMIAYGAARFALARGDRAIARELWPLIQWCLEFCLRRRNAHGVIASDSDELEGRLPAGGANLHTSVLACDALRSAAFLAPFVEASSVAAARYGEEAEALKQAIGRHFGATVEGFATYRYYEGNTDLRAWISSPLAAGLAERKAGTIAALTSPRLWTEDGLATASGKNSFWDRSTLYALRGMFYVGEPDQALVLLRAYSRRRLLGGHVPYAVEAYPEGNQSHLAAESALYARIAIEGMFGIRPAGLRAFFCKPALPSAWPRMALRAVRAFGAGGTALDLEVERSGAGLRLTVLHEGGSGVHLLAPGQEILLSLDTPAILSPRLSPEEAALA